MANCFQNLFDYFGVQALSRMEWNNHSRFVFLIDSMASFCAN